MKYRNLGESGLKVSEIALGSWMTNLAQPSAVETARETIKFAFDSGVNFFDCADAYSSGEAERFLGQVLKDYPRHELVISSKVYFPTGAGINDRGLSRKHILENCSATLKNMQVDYLDLYYCHRYDTGTPMEETLRAMSDLVTQGKILYYGVSEEWGSDRIEEAQRIIEHYNLYPLTVIQPQYNMLDRYIEHSLLDTCRKYGIGITSFSPLSQGILTGKYKRGQAYPAGSRAVHQADHQVENLLTDHTFEIVEKLTAISDELNIPLAVLAMAWILQKKEISCIITGASSPKQLQNNLSASDYTIPQQILEKIEEILDFKKFERHVG